MRCKHVTFLLFFALFCMILFKFFSNLPLTSHPLYHKYNINKTRKVKVPSAELVTLILRQFEPFENDVKLTAESFQNAFPNVVVWIVSDNLPYPPLDIDFTNSSLKLYNLAPTLQRPQSLLSQIKTKYVLFIPDSVRVTSRRPIEAMLEASRSNPNSIISLSAPGKRLKCLRINFSRKEWTLKYSSIKGNECDAVAGKHVILVNTNLLHKMYDFLLLPFPQSLYVQAAVHNVKVVITRANSIHNGNPLLKSHQSQLKKRQADQEVFKTFYKKFNIKQVIRDTGISEWYGCNKDTPRCFGAVLDSTPSYLFEKKWTPPCCMANLRKTAWHVFSVLDEAGVRYWLDEGSLLGAMRSGDILPWDYNVDLGFIKEDTNRCKWLKRCQNQPATDKKGFLWEKIGSVYQVSYSKINKIQVNLFPFYLKNGTMLKDVWFPDDTKGKGEFAETFLHPMSSIDFVGRSVPSPNNIRDFLELKYGKGCIENPEYPEPSKVKFP